MAGSTQDLVRKVIEGAHAQLSTFAQDSYGMHGRGVTLVEAPEVPPGATALVLTGMVYQPLEEVRTMTSGLSAESEADVLLRMMETYDPAKQAVIMVAIAGRNPITVKMRLDEPYLDQ